MRFNNYLNELAMRKGTDIHSPQYYPESIYDQNITLSNGLKFKFICYFFKTEDTWEVAFEDEQERREKAKKPKDTVLELFAALEKVFNTFISKALPNHFRFSADLEEKSRVKLYDLLAKKIKKKHKFKYTKKQSSVSAIYDFKHWSVA